MFPHGAFPAAAFPTASFPRYVAVIVVDKQGGARDAARALVDQRHREDEEILAFIVAWVEIDDHALH